jgi:Ca2+-transporting ATPase
MSVDEAESQLTLLGLVALEDPIRSEVPDAIADCRRAGITAVMITGDHPITAQRIAASLNLDDGQAIVTGPELVSLSDEALRERVRDVRVYARVDPAQKIRIVEALHANGEHVAMTGDGVNDAPALKQASIGVAMGQRGTDVAREAADMVLLDDNFATIVSAIREGRRVYDNIRKFIKYTMTSNTGEIWTLVLALLIGLPVPLLPIHILWINLVTDGLPGLAYSAEPAESDVMRRPPRTPTEGIFARGMWQHMLTIGLMIGALAIVTAVWADTSALRQWQTMVFTTLVIAQLSQALALRSESQTLASLGIFSNPYMIGTIAATLIVQLLVVYLPAFNRFLHTEPLPLADLALCLGLGLVVLPVIEIHKLIRRSRAPGATAVRDP